MRQPRRATPRALDSDSDLFGRLVEDPEILDAFRAAAAPTRPPERLVDVLAHAGDDWSSDVIDALAAAPVEEFRLAFKSQSGNPLRRLLASALRFANVGNATPAMRRLTENAKAALLAIAAESPINAIRVARLGVAADPAARDPYQGQPSTPGLEGS